MSILDKFNMLDNMGNKPGSIDTKETQQTVVATSTEFQQRVGHYLLEVQKGIRVIIHKQKPEEFFELRLAEIGKSASGGIDNKNKKRLTEALAELTLDDEGEDGVWLQDVSGNQALKVQSELRR